MTNPVPVLSDEEVAEIEARPYIVVGWGRRIELKPEERDALCATVRALRADLERVPLAQSALKQLDELQAANRRALAENTALREQLAQVTQDRERLLRGDFTPEEFQNLCHNTDIQAGFDAFADGCEAYQQKMFGRCRTKGTTE